MAEDEIDIWRDVEVYDQWRLLEVSVVTIPANPSAVVVRSQKAMLTREEIREIVKSELDQRKKERQEKREQAEEQKQAVETDARAALSSAYQAIGKQLSYLNKK